MQSIFHPTQHTSARIYLYDSQFTKREALHDPDSIEVTNLNTMGLLDFDLSGLKNQRIQGGRLELKMLTPDYPHEVAITTIQDSWDWRFANNFTARENTPWGGNKWLSDVIMSNGGSVYRRVPTVYDPDTAILSMEVPAEVLQAMAWGISCGLGLIDTKSRSYAPLNGALWCGASIHKRMGASAQCGFLPTLTVSHAPAEPVQLMPVTNFRAMGAENPEQPAFANAILSWNLPAVLPACPCYYQIYQAVSTGEEQLPLSAMTPVIRRLVPKFDGDKWLEGTVLEMLQPDTAYLFAIAVSDGNTASQPVYAAVKTMAARNPLTIAHTDAPFTPECGQLKVPGFAVGVASELDKLDPVTGENYFSAQPLKRQAFAQVSPGEKLGFQVLVENRTDLPQQYTAVIRENAIASHHGDKAVCISRCWYLHTNGRYYPDALIPLAGSFSIPWAENAVEGQRCQSLLVDITVPADTKPGISSFLLEISDGIDTLQLPFRLQVADIRLQKADFKVELNGYVNLSECAGYGKDDPEFSEAEMEYYRLAHAHNMVCNILPYFHTGIVQENFAPTVELRDGVATVTDWSDWDAHFEKYLSGEYLLETTGRKEPVSHIYLPFFENWPMPIHEYYTVDMSDYTSDDYPENINQHKLRARSPYVDFKPGYREGIKSVMKDFIRHIDQKGWNQVTFQYFLNNKHFYKRKGFLDACKNRHSLEFWLTLPTCGNEGKGTSWWLLDEPNFMDDWDAIGYYGSILREAQEETGSGKNIRFRADLSCYNLMFDSLDGILDIGVCGSTFYNNREDYLRERRARYGEDYWVYGSWNAIHENNLQSTLWFLDSYLRGGQGIVPWYNYALEYNYQDADTCAAVYPGKRFGSVKPFPSLRLKAGRKAVELMHYLQTLKYTFGYSDRQLRDYMEAFLRDYGLKLSGETVKENDIDAGTVRYADAADCTALEALKGDIIRHLAAVNQF